MLSRGASRSGAGCRAWAADSTPESRREPAGPGSPHGRHYNTRPPLPRGTPSSGCAHRPRVCGTGAAPAAGHAALVGCGAQPRSGDFGANALAKQATLALRAPAQPHHRAHSGPGRTTLSTSRVAAAGAHVHTLPAFYTVSVPRPTAMPPVARAASSQGRALAAAARHQQHLGACPAAGLMRIRYACATPSLRFLGMRTPTRLAAGCAGHTLTATHTSPQPSGPWRSPSRKWPYIPKRAWSRTPAYRFLS